MPEYYTPGVYVEEISTFPATIVRVPTAVPVFIGHTEKAGSEVLNKAVKVRSLIEYEALYGGEPTTDGREITVLFDANWQPSSVDVSLTFYLYQSLRQFYANGGGDAYILSVGTYSSTGPDKAAMIAALAELEKADEPTLVLVPDAFAFTDPQDLGDVQAQVLMHCAKMQDRFAMLDVLHDSGGNGEADDALAFRNKVGNNNLSYGAAYYPEVKTSLGPTGLILSSTLSLVDSDGLATTLTAVAAGAGETTTGLEEHGQLLDDIETITSTLDSGDYLADLTAADGLVGGQAIIEAKIQVLRQMGLDLLGLGLTHSGAIAALDAIIAPSGALDTSMTLLYTYYLALFDNGSTGEVLGNTPGAIIQPADFPGYGLTGIQLAFPPLAPSVGIYGVPPLTINDAATEPSSIAAFVALHGTLLGYFNSVLSDANDLLATSEEDLALRSGAYAGILAAIRSTGYTLSPTAAVTGAIAVTDANRGVWKAPANISLNAVVDVARRFQPTELDDLNMPTNGKAINAIRPFRGQGILVYGSRTLAGNDNEWRFIPVRRLFLMVEESVRKACEPLVFEPNDANLWQRVRGMIENFLTGIWRDGGLAGATTKDAFFVKVGLGSTMTAEDILEGKMIVEIGMAAVRPAEFVILKFMHKMQES